MLKKPAFLVILILMPLLALGLSLVTGQESGAFTAAVYADPADEAASAFLITLEEAKTIIRLSPCDSEEAVFRAVENGEAEVGWIFRKGFAERLADYVRGVKEEPLVTLVEQEDNVLISLSRERLYTILFPQISYLLFREKALSLKIDPVPTEEELRSYYENVDPAEITSFVDVRGREVKTSSFLVSPARGMLALLILEGGIAGAIFCAEDEGRGVFLRMTRPRRLAVKATAVFLPVADLSLTAYFALWLAGLLTDPLYEILLLLLYLFAAAGLSLLLLAILRAPRPLGLTALFAALLSLALTPTFLDVSGAGYLSFLLPATAYLRSVLVPANVKGLVLYAVLTLSASFLIFLIPRRDG